MDKGRVRSLSENSKKARRRGQVGPLLFVDPSARGLPGERLLQGRGYPERRRGRREVYDDEEREGAFCWWRVKKGGGKRGALSTFYSLSLCIYLQSLSLSLSLFPFSTPKCCGKKQKLSRGGGGGGGTTGRNELGLFFSFF